LPPYAYVPGRSPRPAGLTLESLPFDPPTWRSCRAYLHGIDLFNHGYYWEAHESWEGLWHGCGRRGTTADFLKGLIQLAVAGVKVRQGISEGVRRHAARAGELFRQMANATAGEPRYAGLDLSYLIRTAGEVARTPPSSRDTTGPEVEVVFDFVLRPSDERR
jgi:hypothetical protein